jgi:UDP-N-acetylmuramoyl-L-alanyl-D-glutamate--2,6-diaminopimelate ligase
MIRVDSFQAKPTIRIHALPAPGNRSPQRNGCKEAAGNQHNGKEARVMRDAPVPSNSAASSPKGNLSSGLRDLFPQATFQRCHDIPLGRCSIDWSECRKGDLFLAIETPENDGHNDVNRAIARGAQGIITERLLPVSVPQCVVTDSRIAWARICHAHAGNPAQHVDTTLVAGSDGKSTTAHLLNSILNEPVQPDNCQQPGLCPLSAIGNAHGECGWTPPALSAWLGEQLAGGKKSLIIEASESDLLGRTMEGCHYNSVILTNIRTRMAQRQRGFLKAIDYLAPGGTMVVNADDPVTGSRLSEIDAPVMTVGIREDADVAAKILESDARGQIFSITAGDTSAVIQSSVPGAAFVYNSLLAVAAGLLKGISLETIAGRLQGCKGLPGRMEVIDCTQPFTVLVDQADTPWRLGATLNMLRHNIQGRIIVVFSAPEIADATLAAEFGRVAEKGSFLPVITRPRVGLPVDHERCHQVMDGFRRKVRARSIPDRMAAIEWALSQAQEGDAVLIAGSGDRSICSLGDNRWQLCDAEVCQAWLWENARQPAPVPDPSLDSPRIYRIEDFRDARPF